MEVVWKHSPFPAYAENPTPVGIFGIELMKFPSFSFFSHLANALKTSINLEENSKFNNEDYIW